ncbi:hypothetical protein GBL98_20760 [Yersinia pseudotuberculosis]|uniref:Uncharacterized protein n=1 Tax=Yersinia pseudotuberculosis TaxID=633 RepID=A0ABN5R7A3_YERPU|nr:hypothetical protein [Yersinia pseudotuberculosis]AYW90257.1 hypothetical protein EGX47_02140 [Yersinia pseudotuberculosis]AYW92801.1 hypothetical protein EGX47_16850 [Yersinia pseudotuberculosis]AYX13055.1 hypothetical protein EGX52_21075 [Yersinia pseudotuberculosis]MBO1609287.1 hypothetical protein [Yersinia pseudotuberculosis]MBO1613381.1 hypothetical protein [Yersinia pseudotuberculosis]
MTIRKENYAEIIAGCLSAFDCAKRGEEHERLYENGYVYAGMLHKINAIAAHRPPLPRLMADQRQAANIDNWLEYYAANPNSQNHGPARTSSDRGGYGD